jgi:hypothetical protein
MKLATSLLAQSLSQERNHGSHFRQGVAGLIRSSGTGEPKPKLHHLEIPDQDSLFEGLITQSGAVPGEVREHPVVTLERLPQQIALAFRDNGRSLAVSPQQENAGIAEPISEQNQRNYRNQYACNHFNSRDEPYYANHDESTTRVRRLQYLSHISKLNVYKNS